MTDDNSPDNSLGRPASHLWSPGRPAVAALRHPCDPGPLPTHSVWSVGFVASLVALIAFFIWGLL